MLLQNLPKKEQETRLNAKVKQSTADSLSKYVDYVNSNMELDLSQDEVLDSVITTLLNKDKKFKAWVKAKSDQKTEKPITQETNGSFTTNEPIDEKDKIAS